ncbi:MAG: GNAT family N-acetyltransferase [Caldilineaceae bacterium]|nr:GNAT family N-acetyltransferase [Caldilineaceae bacterium]
MIELETERLTLRKGRTAPPTQAELKADYHRYVTGFADPDVTFAQYQDVILGLYYKDREGGPFGYYTIYPKGSDRWIGHCPLIPRLCTPAEVARFRPDGNSVAPYQTLEVEIGWALIMEARGQGFATEAAQALLDYGFRTLRVQRIVAFTERENSASIRVMERLGMVVDQRSDTEQVVGSIENSAISSANQ